MRRFLECLVPVTACNLKCSYCYVIQESRRKNERAVFEKSPEYIGKALSAKRLGGTSYISICGAGETLMSPELPEVVKNILLQGYFVNITTNCTLTNCLVSMLEATEGMHERLHFAVSFHYVELLKRNLLDTFFDNIRLIREAGCSFVLQINLVDEYIPYWEEIKHISKERVGAYPQVALTRDESSCPFKIMTSLSNEDYYKVGSEMESPLFDFTYKNFNVKRKEFCYAGYWSAKLNLCTGVMTGCYGQGLRQNIYEDLDKDIKWVPIGKNCTAPFCFNSSHFMSQGIIPSLLPLPNYASLRNRDNAGWYTPCAKEFLGRQFEDTNRVPGHLWELYHTSVSILKRKMRSAIKIAKSTLQH